MSGDSGLQGVYSRVKICIWAGAAAHVSRAHDEERRRAFERLGKRAKGCLWSKYGYLGSSRSLSFQGGVGNVAVVSTCAQTRPPCRGRVRAAAPCRLKTPASVALRSHLVTFETASL